MSEIHSYFIDRKHIVLANPNHSEATFISRFVYKILDTQFCFNYYHNKQDQYDSLLQKLKLFTPITLTFEDNNVGEQENLLRISRTPHNLHYKNPFILVTFSPYSDNSRHWCSPTSIPNPPKITIYDNPKILPLPPATTLFSNPHLLQFTCIADPNHRSNGFPRARAIKKGDSIVIPLPQITNGLTFSTLKDIKDHSNIRLFIGFDDEECCNLAPNITPQECDDNNITLDASPAQVIEFVRSKLNSAITHHLNLENVKETARQHLERLNILSTGQGAVLIHADRCPQLQKARAISLARAFASRAPSIPAYTLTPLHMCSDSVPLAEELNPPHAC